MSYTTQTVVLEEPLLFERSRPQARGYQAPANDVPAALPQHSHLLRTAEPRLPEVSEPEVVRHFTRLSTWNYAIDLGIYPLGSCTMKYNPRFHEHVARGPEICALHPYDPLQWAQGHLQIMYELQEDLKAITGLAGVCLQPSAGAQGEFTGLLLIDAYHKHKGQHKKTILTADTSHGTNPASAALAGFHIVQIPTGTSGYIDVEALCAVLTDDVAALMVTNPNTLGFFEKNIREIADKLHQKGALLYIDGANMNAVLGLSRPGDYGADVIQFNLHKTFTTPHGGGGPGSGPIAVSDCLLPFLPIPRLEKQGETYGWQNATEAPHNIGRVKAFYGNFGMFVRAWCYIRALGAPGLRAVSEDAILNANYIKSQLKDLYHIPVDGPHLHEIVFSDKNTKENGFDTSKIAKALIDKGIHPPTVHFPLCVKNALMIEPTETETRTEMDRFVHAMRTIPTQDAQESYPLNAVRRRIDEVKAARDLNLNWFAGSAR